MYIISTFSLQGHIPLTSERAMAMRFSRDCDACDGDGQCEFCSVEFHLWAKCIGEQTLDVTSKKLISSYHTVVPVEFESGSGYENAAENKRNLLTREKNNLVHQMRPWLWAKKNGSNITRASLHTSVLKQYRYRWQPVGAL